MDRMGTIDKYMGDCIMAFWNAPVDVPTHVTEACNSALVMFEKLEELNQELENEAISNNKEFRPLKIGIGLNTARAVWVTWGQHKGSTTQFLEMTSIFVRV